MKPLYILLAFIFFGSFAYSQSVATAVSYDKASHPGLVLAVPYSEQIAEGAIVQKLSEIGFVPETKGALFWKKSKLNGFYVFRNVALRDTENQMVDLYFNVEKKSRKDEQCNIYMLVNKNGEFVSSETNPVIFDAANNFLNSLSDYSAGYKMDTDIKNQEKAITNAEKKHQQLQNDEQNLQRRIQKLEQELSENRTQQENQLKTIEAERQKLEDLKAKKG